MLKQLYNTRVKYSKIAIILISSSYTIQQYYRSLFMRDTSE